MSKKPKNKFSSSPKIFIWQGHFKGGGANKVTLEIARVCRDKFGLNPTLGVFDKNDNFDFSQIKAPRIFPTKRLQGYNHLFASYWLNKKGVLNKFDIVFAHVEAFWKTSDNFYVAHQAGDLDKIYNCKTVKSKIAYYFIYKSAISCLKKADLILYTKEDVKNFLERYDLSPIAPTKSFVNVEKFEDKDTLSPHDPFRVLFVGDQHGVKNLSGLKKAIKELDNVELWVAGMTQKNTRKIKYLGWKDNMEQVYNKVDLVCAPYLSEDFPLVLLEALSCKVPVLLSVAPAPDELKRYIPVCGKTPSAIQEALRNSISNYKQLKKKIDKAHQFVRDNYFKEGVITKEIKTLLSYYQK